MGALDSLIAVDVRMPGGFKPRVVVFNFTTDGAGALTVAPASDPNNQLPVTRSGNNYIVTVGPYKRVLSGNMFATALNTTRTDDPVAGTVQFNYGGSQNSVANGWCLMFFDV